jgi:hypothetical protein
VKKLILLAIALAVMPSFLALASEYEVKGKAGNYNVEVRMDKNPPARGNNNMDVVITDAAGKPITGAEVGVEYSMPSFYPGRPPMMKYDTTAKPRDHAYLAQINLSMAGKWTVVLRVTHSGKTDTMEFSFVVK